MCAASRVAPWRVRICVRRACASGACMAQGTRKQKPKLRTARARAKTQQHRDMEERKRGRRCAQCEARLRYDRTARAHCSRSAFVARAAP
eukprot:4019464-Prymnesium_polylepis.1